MLIHVCIDLSLKFSCCLHLFTFVDCELSHLVNVTPNKGSNKARLLLALWEQKVPAKS